PAREGTEIVSADGAKIGVVTSGGFGPSVNGPVAIGYVARAFSTVGTKVQLMVRGKPLPAEIAAMPLHPHRYKRG
ncbi:MAG TPA: glycine cleavage T C-terminal barrel domain-containing protein, partial [Hyphomicrobiaceae bacterium]|nr:glycine cleavage T C-terminal barrel domain-containing protein [Hyphomicrobiaceae bacterium]